MCALGLADPLEDHLLRRLGGDPAEVVGSDVAGLDLVPVGLEALRLQLRLLGLAPLARLRIDGGARDLNLGNLLAGGLGRLGGLELVLELLVEQLLLEVLGNDQLVDPEVGGAVVELDPGVLGRAGGLLVGGEERVGERVHQRVRVDSLLLLERLDGVDDLLGHAATSVRRATDSSVASPPAGSSPSRRVPRRSPRPRRRSASRPVKLLPPVDLLVGPAPAPDGRRSAGSARAWSAAARVPATRPRATMTRAVLGSSAVTRSQSAMSTPLGAVDHQAEALGGGPLEGEQLDLRLRLAQPGLDLLLDLRKFRVAHLQVFPVAHTGLPPKKRRACAHLSTRAAGVKKVPQASIAPAIAPAKGLRLQTSTIRDRAVVDEGDAHAGAEDPLLRPEPLAEAVVERLGLVRRAPPPCSSAGCPCGCRRRG